MKINELKSLSSDEKRSFKSIFAEFQKADELIEDLKKYGFEEIGDGTFSVVYGKAGINYVVKIAYGDSSYYNFSKYTGNKRFNKYLPRIFKTIRLKDGKAYIIEKLYPLSDREGTLFAKLAALSKYRLANPDEAEDHAKPYIDAALKISDRYPELFMTIVDLAKHDLFNDLHEDNIMKRKDGSIVIIDPVAY